MGASLDSKLKQAKTNGTLDLSCQNITKIPNKITNVINSEKLIIKRLNISNNRINIESLDSFFTCTHISQLAHLNISSNGLSTFPTSIITFFCLLRRLDISHNKITELPDSVGNLIHLEMLVLSDNRIQSLPYSVLVKMETLLMITIDLNFIDISKIPRNVREIMHGANRQYVPQKILENFFFGSYQAACNLSELQTRNITHILTVGSRLTPKFPEKFNYHIIDVEDRPDVNLKAFFSGSK